MHENHFAFKWKRTEERNHTDISAYFKCLTLSIKECQVMSQSRNSTVLLEPVAGATMAKGAWASTTRLQQTCYAMRIPTFHRVIFV